MTDFDRPMTTDALIRDHVAELLGPALRRQCWLLLLDARAQPLDLLMPSDDLPVDPDPIDVDRFAAFVRAVIDAAGAHEALVVWERPGGPELRLQESGWVLGLAAAGLPLRAQLLASDDAVRVIDVATELAEEAAA